jgi:S-adenosyl-L-methionine hydrolase (adenosine-forming)
VVVTLLTDYGEASEFAGVCRGVIAGIAPGAPMIDITHGIARHSIRHGALVLRDSLPFMPVGVHMAVVDPQVGTERRAVALRCADDRVLVGPDNGLLSLAWEASGGVLEAVDVSRSPHRLEPVSATFHGRDLFAPVAAHLAAGAPLLDAGQPLDPDELTVLELPRPHSQGGALVAHALLVDVFGNVMLNARHDDLAGTGLQLGRQLEVGCTGRTLRATFAHTFADVGPGELLLYEDASRTLALAVNRGDAAAVLGVEPDSEVRLIPL